MKLSPDHTSHRWKTLLAFRSLRFDLVLKILIGVLVIVVIVLMFPHPESQDYSYSIGAVWADKDLIAPFSFPIYKDLHQYEKERQEAVRNVYPVFERNDAVPRAAAETVKAIVASLHEAASARVQIRKKGTQSDSSASRQAPNIAPLPLTDAERDFLTKMYVNESHGKNDFDRFEGFLLATCDEIFRDGVIEQIRMKQAHALFAVRRGTSEDIMSYERIYDEDQAANVLASRVASGLSEDALSSLALKIGHAVLHPNLLFNRNETARAVQAAEDDVPRTIGFIQENERIISKHDRITDDVKLKLDSFRKAKAERGSTFTEWKHWIGITLHVCIILGLYSIYLYLFRKRIFNNNGNLTLVALLLLLETFLAYLSLAVNVSEPIQYLIFVPVASMLLTIIFDSRVAFYGTVTTALLVAGIRGNDYAIALSSLVAGALAAYTVRDIKNRTQIFRSLIFIFLGYLVSIVALSLEQFESFTTIVTAAAFALANAVFSPVLTYGLLFFFERVFNITTDLTLLELSDFNQPLLRQLSEKAPGTFHHSITIGNLAEAAAEAIGANSILARVGGYYHDIGKMLKPEYFVENQVGTHNRHARLKPRMSALILQSHVKEGVEMGRENGIPEKILDFIPQHHGTTRISFFFDKALKQAAKRPTKDVINEEDFRYPGPKPQTKETGIVMLADSVEASTRSIEEITPQKLDLAIENMIKHRFVEGQLDECELTLRDLTKIKDAFMKILIGIHHHRIQYPGQQADDHVEPPEQTQAVIADEPAAVHEPPHEEPPPPAGDNALHVEAPPVQQAVPAHHAGETTAGSDLPDQAP